MFKLKIKVYLNMTFISKRSSLLITGSHRSGSTWIGKVFNSSNTFDYIEEPLNLTGSSHQLKGLTYWYENIEDKQFLILQLKIQKYKSLLKCKRELYKDPISFFSLPTYIEQLNSDVLISVRHPAAFISSLKRLNWTFDFKHLLKQTLLMDGVLKPFEKEIAKYAKCSPNIIDQGILLWNVIYATAQVYKKKYPQIYIVRHEDLSREPIKEFKAIFSEFNIPFTPEVEKYIFETTNKANMIEANDGEIHQLKRNSSENIKTFKTRLSDEEIKYIRKKTEAYAKVYYSDEDWV